MPGGTPPPDGLSSPVMPYPSLKMKADNRFVPEPGRRAGLPLQRIKGDWLRLTTYRFILLDASLRSVVEHGYGDNFRSPPYRQWLSLA